MGFEVEGLDEFKNKLLEMSNGGFEEGTKELQKQALWLKQK